MRRFRQARRVAVVVAGALAVGVTGMAGPTSAATSYNPNATVRVGFTLSPTFWDPLRINSANSAQSYLVLPYDQLIEYGPNLKPKPEVATSWTPAPDGKSITLTLRNDVKFWDGTPVNAAAVKANLDRVKANPAVGPGLPTMKSVDVLNNTTIRVNFSEKTYNFPDIVAQDTRIGSIVNPKAFSSSSLATKPEGSGPYRLVSATSQNAIFERVPNHWDKTSGLAKRVELKTILDPNARVNALRSGQIDVAFTVSDQVDDTRKAARLNTFQDTPAIQALLLNYTKGPLADPKVRKAISLAINRRTLVQSAFGGLCRPTQQIFNKLTGGWLGSLDSDAELKQDIPAAQKLMDQAGVKSMNFSMLVSSGNNSTLTATQIMQQELAEIGIKVSVTVQPTAQAGPNFGDGKFDGYVASLNGATESQLIIDTNLRQKGKGFGVPGYLSFAATQAAKTAPGRARDAAYEKISKELVDAPTHIAYCSNPIFLGLNPKIVGIENMGYGRTIQGIIDVRRIGLKP